MSDDFVVEPILRRKIGDLAGGSFYSSFWRRELEGVFRGDESVKESEARCLSIPAADTGKDLCFNNREMLSRFALVPLHAQAEFLRFIRQTLALNGVKEGQFDIEWSKKKTRVLQVKVKSEYDGPLDIFLL